MMPTRSFIDCCSSACSVYGFSALAVRGSNGASAIRAAARRRPRTPSAGRSATDVVGRAEPGPAAEHQQVRQRVAAEPVGAVHAAGALARREQAGHAAPPVSGSTSMPPMT